MVRWVLRACVRRLTVRSSSSPIRLPSMWLTLETISRRARSIPSFREVGSLGTLLWPRLRVLTKVAGILV